MGCDGRHGVDGTHGSDGPGGSRDSVGAAAAARRDGIDGYVGREGRSWWWATPDVAVAPPSHVRQRQAVAVGPPPPTFRQVEAMAMAAEAFEDAGPPTPPPPSVLFSTLFPPPPPGPPGSGRGRLHGWPQAPPAVTHEGPETPEAWVARTRPPYFRCMANWVRYLEWGGLIRCGLQCKHRCNEIEFTDFETF